MTTQTSTPAPAGKTGFQLPKWAGSFGFQIIAGEGAGPGVWMYHCHVQTHSDGGMVGLFLVRNADGGMPAGAQDAIDRFKMHGHPGHETNPDVHTHS